MRLGGAGALRLGLPLALGAMGAFAPAVGAAPLDDATALFRQRKFTQARAILGPLAASEPSNAAAAYLLGMAFLREGGPGALDSARPWLGKSVKLAPGDESYLADYAGVTLLMADRDNSFSLALDGRESMTRAIEAKPDDLDACDGLMKFYAKAPWPLGDAGKALALAAQIAKYDPMRGAAAYRSIQATFERKGRTVEAKSAADAAQSLAPAPPK
jgi:Flp pilus assembly protein TadD